MRPRIEQVPFAHLNNNPDVHELVRQYAEESHYDGLPYPDPDIGMYERLDAAGALICYAAYCDGRVVGFMIAIASSIPHYRQLMVSNESLFVAKPYRSTGAGVALIRSMVDHAKGIGAAAFMTTAPLTNGLGKILTRMGFKHTNMVLCKAL